MADLLIVLYGADRGVFLELLRLRLQWKWWKKTKGGLIS